MRVLYSSRSIENGEWSVCSIIRSGRRKFVIYRKYFLFMIEFLFNLSFRQWRWLCVNFRHSSSFVEKLRGGVTCDNQQPYLPSCL